MLTFCKNALLKDADGSITSCPDLHYLYPIPDDVVKDADKGILSDSEYSWRTDNWGTKWNTYSDNGVGYYTGGDVDGQIIGIGATFETAWSPPVEGILKGSKKFPHLMFYLEYAEMGVEFKGIAMMQDGELIFQHTEKPKTDAEWESMYYEGMTDPVQIAHIKALREDLDRNWKYVEEFPWTI